MQVVINISDSVYKDLKLGIGVGVVLKLEDIVVLPTGHGRLIDADKVRAKFVEYRSKWDAKCLKLQTDNDYELGRWESYDFAVDDIDAAPTIIEADGGAE